MRCLFLVFSTFLSFSCFAETLTMNDAIKIAERFIVENGYTEAININFKDPLELESMEFTSEREKLLKYRFGQLRSKAIGAKKTSESWHIAFDFSEFESKEICRVVILKLDGSLPHMAHQSGSRSYFLGFE